MRLVIPKSSDLGGFSVRRACFAERIKVTNARLHVLATELGVPLLVKAHDMCDPEVNTCLGMAARAPKAQTSAA